MNTLPRLLVATLLPMLFVPNSGGGTLTGKAVGIAHGDMLTVLGIVVPPLHIPENIGQLTLDIWTAPADWQEWRSTMAHRDAQTKARPLSSCVLGRTSLKWDMGMVTLAASCQLCPVGGDAIPALAQALRNAPDNENGNIQGIMRYGRPLKSDPDEDALQNSSIYHVYPLTDRVDELERQVNSGELTPSTLPTREKLVAIVAMAEKLQAGIVVEKASVSNESTAKILNDNAKKLDAALAKLDVLSLQVEQMKRELTAKDKSSDWPLFVLVILVLLIAASFAVIAVRRTVRLFWPARYSSACNRLSAPGASEGRAGEGPPTSLATSLPSTFDVFLSHNCKDKRTIRRLKKQLMASGLTVWLDEDKLRPGIPWHLLLEDGIRSSASVAVVIGKDGIGPWEDEEMQAALRLAVKEKRPVIPVLLPGSPAQPELPIFLGNRTWVDLREGLTEAGLAKLVWGITGRKS